MVHGIVREEAHDEVEIPVAPRAEKIADETGDKIVYVDIPLNFVSETPDVPEMGSKDKKK